MIYDVIIVGGGPAGLTAALYAARAGHSALVLERAVAGGQIVNSPLVENYPALPHVSGADFAGALSEQVDALGVEICYAEALSAEKTAEGFLLQTDDGEKCARALILAPGMQHRALGVEGEEELIGSGVSYCAVCDGAFYAGRDVAVVGGGDTAVQDALFLSKVCRNVTVLVRRDVFRGEARRVEALLARPNVRVHFRTTVEALRSADGSLTGVAVRDAETGTTGELAVDGLFLAVGQTPSTAAFAGLVDCDDTGFIRCGEDTATDCPGVFAAGDCRTKTVRQLTTAVGDGAAAALAACRYVEAL